MRAKSHTGGRPSAFNEQEEKKLVEYLRILTQWGFGLSRTELLNCIEQFVTENGTLKHLLKIIDQGRIGFLILKNAMVYP